MSLFYELTYWHWLIVCAVLLLLEMLTGGGFLLCIALSGLFTALLVASVSWTWAPQLLFFTGFSLINCLLWGWYLRKHRMDTALQHPQLNKRAAQYIGQTFQLTEAIENGRGRIRVDDTIWRVQGPDLPVGSKVKVEGIESGMIFLVKPADNLTHGK
jgi:membrane protein implicated in regulation of membrane protease activity